MNLIKKKGFVQAQHGNPGVELNFLLFRLPYLTPSTSRDSFLVEHAQYSSRCQTLNPVDPS